MTDLIEREAALACFPDWMDKYGHEHSADEDAVYQKIADLPSVQPECKPTCKPMYADVSDLISRQAAIDALVGLTNLKSVRKLNEYCMEHGLENYRTGGIVDAIDAVIAVPPANTDLSEYSDKLWRSAYERGKAEAEKPQWIPCSERLPEMDETVLVIDSANEFHIWDSHSNRSDNYAWEDESGYCHDRYDVVAWRELPEPYREDVE